MAIYSEFSHWKWWFSIAMLNYQRVYILYILYCLVVLTILKSGKVLVNGVNGKDYISDYHNILSYWLVVGLPILKNMLVNGKDDIPCNYILYYLVGGWPTPLKYIAFYCRLCAGTEAANNPLQPIFHEIFWLVVLTILKNISQLELLFPYIMGKKSCSKPPTSYISICS